MIFFDAQQLIKQSFTLTEYDTDISIINIDKLLTYSNYYFIALLEDNNQAKLSDMGKTNESILLPEDTWQTLCKKFHLEYKDGIISTPFNSMLDLVNYINLLDLISSKQY